MRARNIKPGFFNNDHLLQCEPLARILFEGLWCLADREGRLEDRPIKIKIEVLPCDNCDVDDLLRQLEEKKDDDGSPALICRYRVVDKRYIQVVNFSKHQNPHQRETKSVIPALQGDAKKQLRHNQGTAQDAPFEAKPDMAGGGSPADSLIPDSLIPEFKKASRAREGNHHPVDNSIPDPAPESEPEPDIDTTGQVDQDPEIPQHEAAFFENLKATLKKLEPIYTSAYDRRQLMLFAETHKNSKNLDAIIHALNALITAHEKGTTIQNLKRYLDVIVKEESKNYNAAESQRRSDSYKTDPGNLTALGSILDNVHAMRNANSEDIKNRGQTQEQT